MSNSVGTATLVRAESRFATGYFADSVTNWPSSGSPHDHRAGSHPKFCTGVDGLPVLPLPGDFGGVEDRCPRRPELRSRQNEGDRLMVGVKAQHERIVGDPF